MKRTSFLSVIVFSILLTSCDNANDIGQYPGSVTFNSGDFEVINLKNGRLLELTPPANPGIIDIYDTLLIITGTSMANNYMLHVYDTRDGKHLNSFAALGRAPGEFLFVANPRILHESRELYFVDYNSRVVAIYCLDSLLQETIQPVKIASFQEEELYLELKVDRSGYISRPWHYGFYAEGSTMMLAKYDIESRTIVNRVSFPIVGELDSVISRQHQASIFTIGSGGHLSYNETSGRIVLAHSKMDLVEVFDRDLNPLTRIHGPVRHYPVFEFADRKIVGGRAVPGERRSPVARSATDMVVFPEEHYRWCYREPVAVANGFYVKYLGKNPGDEYFLNYSLFFFRYDGTPVVCYEFDIDNAPSFAIDEKRGIIFLIGRDGEIYLYDIPEHVHS